MWIKWIRPLVIAMIFVITGFIIGSIVATKISLAIIDANQIVMIKAIEKHSVSNDIDNEIEIKNKKGETVLNLDNEPLITNEIEGKEIVTNSRKGTLLSRFFGKNSIDEVENKE